MNKGRKAASGHQITRESLAPHVEERIERLEEAVFGSKRPSYPSECPACGYVDAQVSHVPQGNIDPFLASDWVRQAFERARQGEHVLQATCERCEHLYFIYPESEG